MTRMTTHNEETKGIVLKSMPYKENDQLVTIYSYEFGKLTMRARGTKKMTSKNAPSVMSITESLFEISLREGLSTLIRGQALSYYEHIKQTLECEIVADYLLEYFYRYVEENKPSASSYAFLKGVLDALEEGYDYRTVYGLINCFIMKENGVQLNVDGCAVCTQKKVTAFSLERGGFVCAKHRHPRDLALSAAELQAIRHLYKCPVAKISALYLHDLKRVLPIFEYYIDEYCGIDLKSKKFIQTIMSE